MLQRGRLDFQVEPEKRPITLLSIDTVCQTRCGQSDESLKAGVYRKRARLDVFIDPGGFICVLYPQLDLLQLVVSLKIVCRNPHGTRLGNYQHFLFKTVSNASQTANVYGILQLDHGDDSGH